MNVSLNTQLIVALASVLRAEAKTPNILKVLTTQTEEESSAQGHSECSTKVSYPPSLPPKIKTHEELKRELGYNGTFGDIVGHMAFINDSDSDIPEELHQILKKNSQLRVSDLNNANPLGRAIGSPSDLGHKHNLSTSSTKRSLSASPCSGLPPSVPLPTIANLTPVFRATITDDQDREAALTGSEPNSPHSQLENETKKSFDFTGEINKLNASGEANRLSLWSNLNKHSQIQKD
jgi:hypothetical protein